MSFHYRPNGEIVWLDAVPDVSAEERVLKANFLPLVSILRAWMLIANMEVPKLLHDVRLRILHLARIPELPSSKIDILVIFHERLPPQVAAGHGDGKLCVLHCRCFISISDKFNTHL